MNCSNCGAKFEDHLKKCPYCGAFHYDGARKEYMKKLGSMKQDLDTLHDSIPGMYKEELKNQSRLIKKMICWAIGVFCVLAVIISFNIFLENRDSKDAKEALLFTREAYPIADEYYNAGDYEGLLEFYQTSVAKNENSDFYHWDHYTFLICYENLCIFREAADKLSNGEKSAFVCTEMFYSYIANHFYQKEYSTDQADLQLIGEFEDEMEAVIEDIGLNESEKYQLNEFLNSADYPSWKEIEEFSSSIYERLYEGESK